MKALSLVPGLPARPKVLDVGCGPGRQTLILARETGGEITAVDNHQPYLDELLTRAEKQGFDERIATECCSMDDMRFDDVSFDLVWGEGSIYIMGFQKGLISWRRFLRRDGSMAVTELSWLVDSPPEEVKSFFEEAYPAMQTVARNTEMIRESGYSLIDSFTLPESAWWDGYYGPMEKRISELREKHSPEPAILEVLDGEQKEIDLYRRRASGNFSRTKLKSSRHFSAHSGETFSGFLAWSTPESSRVETNSRLEYRIAPPRDTIRRSPGLSSYFPRRCRFGASIDG